MLIGYIRVSTIDKNTTRPEVLMAELAGEQLFIDRISGKNTNRPELKRMLEFIREGDIVVVESISRFARNTRDLLELIEQLTEKKVEFISKKESNAKVYFGQPFDYNAKPKELQKQKNAVFIRVASAKNYHLILKKS